MSELLFGDVTCLSSGPGANKTIVDNAVLDMETAYVDATGRTLPDGLNLGSGGEIGGLTLTPGLYKWGTDVTIGVTSPANLVLDCQGNSSAVFIFQLDGKLNVASGKQVTLTNSCQSKNIFWAVAGQTTLGTTSVFNGNILAGGVSTIALQTGATLNGRALSQFEATLQSNVVNVPV